LAAISGSEMDSKRLEVKSFPITQHLRMELYNPKAHNGVLHL